MSYESKMADDLAMPERMLIEASLLKFLLFHGGVIKEFGQGEPIVRELADEFHLNDRQRHQTLETIYRKENRRKTSLLWHRLLFRAAAALARKNLVSRPTDTFQLTNRREWMLTERGFDEALKLSGIPISRKDSLLAISFEVQKIASAIAERPKPENYNPIDTSCKAVKRGANRLLRQRGFRQAVVEAYGHKCAMCGLKLASPDCLSWEVEAAHIVPSCAQGRDDIWNGIALCRLHHWAFDIGWFTFSTDYQIQVSNAVHRLPPDYGIMGGHEFIRAPINKPMALFLPNRREIHPDPAAIRWHNQHVFNRQPRM